METLSGGVQGRGRSGGAGTIVNAFATGRGVAFGLAWSVEAHVEPWKRDEVWSGQRRLPTHEAALALETAQLVGERLENRRPVRIRVRSAIPARRGLKSSSAVGVAVARATLDLAGARWKDQEFLQVVVEAALRSRTSLTGALDDAAACLWGGIVFADNDRRRVVATDELPRDVVALVRVPRKEIATASLDRARFRSLAPAARRAWRAARARDITAAMKANTDAYAPVLGLRTTFSQRAMDAGAWAAGLSGKGPAEIALVRLKQLARVRAQLPPCRLVEVRRRDSP